jgi:hypothetical protein
MRVIGAAVFFTAGFLVARYIYLPETSLEKAGKTVDKIVAQAMHSEKPRTQKGPLEKAGETVDEAMENIRDPAPQKNNSN